MVNIGLFIALKHKGDDMDRQGFKVMCDAENIHMDFSIDLIFARGLDGHHRPNEGCFSDGRTEAFYRGYLLRISQERNCSNKQSVQMNKDNV